MELFIQAQLERLLCKLKEGVKQTILELGLAIIRGQEQVFNALILQTPKPAVHGKTLRQLFNLQI
jgi:hypothetical protein